MDMIDSTTCSYKESPRSRRVTWDVMTIHYFEEPGRNSETKAIPAKTKKEKAFDSMVVDLSDIFDENSGVELQGVRRRRKSVAWDEDFSSLENSPSNSDLFGKGAYSGDLNCWKTQSLDEIPSLSQSLWLITSENYKLQLENKEKYNKARDINPENFSISLAYYNIKTSLTRMWQFLTSTAIMHISAGIAEVRSRLETCIAHRKIFFLGDYAGSLPFDGSYLDEKDTNSMHHRASKPSAIDDSVNTRLSPGFSHAGHFKRIKQRRVRQVIILARRHNDSRRTASRYVPCHVSKRPLSLTWSNNRSIGLAKFTSSAIHRFKLSSPTKPTKSLSNTGNKQFLNWSNRAKHHMRIRHSFHF